MDGHRPGGAGTRNSGKNGKPVTASGHSRGIRSGRRSSSWRAHRTHGKFTLGGAGLPSSWTALTVSTSGEVVNLVAARSATSSCITYRMPRPPDH